jgi:hypothetical protein
MPQQEVRHSDELDRILQIPSRTLSLETGADLAQRLTPLLRTELGAEHGVSLRAIQAIALDELWRMHGLFAAIAVGGGKTLITWLAPYILDSKRPLLLVPANLRTKTYNDFGMLSRFWVSPKRLARLESYNQLSLLQSASMLDDYQPDLIIADEVDKLRKTDVAAWVRVQDYLSRHPECVFVALTGTILRKSIKDMAHLLIATLGAGAPVPRRWVDLEEWSGALDLKVDVMSRYRPGALRLLVPGNPNPTVEHVRQGFQERLRSTPGVIIIDAEECEQPITIRMLTAMLVSWGAGSITSGTHVPRKNG